MNHLLLLSAVSHKVRTYSRVPASAIPNFINIVKPALEVMVGALNSGDDDLFTQALQSFLIIPQFALTKTSSETSNDLVHRLLEFSEGPREKPARLRPPPERPPQEFEALPLRIKKAIAQAKFQAGEGRLLESVPTTFASS